MAQVAERIKAPGALAQIGWMARMLLKSDPAEFYGSLQKLVVPDQGDATSLDSKFWFNLGYWKTANTYAAAGAALADELARAAVLGPDDVVLDVGFGFGEQDLQWVANYNVKRIVGVNIAREHVEFARQRATLAGLSDRIEFRQGDALDLPFPDASFDKVVALESAHHFNPREQFFRDAFRVLKPGGILATADIVAATEPRPVNRLSAWMTRRMTGSPHGNFYPREAYSRKLSDSGFTKVHVESIREHVHPGNLAYYRLKKKGMRADEIVIDAIDQATIDEAYKKWGEVEMGDYIMATAQKPHAV